MKTIREYWLMIKKTHGDKLLLGFVIFYFADCWIIMLCDPALENYGDALWMGFSVATTIGLGDYSVTASSARFFTILLGVYGCVMEAYIPGLIASYYLQSLSRRRDAIVRKHLNDLQNLDSMTQQEKRKLSLSIRKEGTR